MLVHLGVLVCCKAWACCGGASEAQRDIIGVGVMAIGGRPACCSAGTCGEPRALLALTSREAGMRWMVTMPACDRLLRDTMMVESCAKGQLAGTVGWRVHAEDTVVRQCYTIPTMVQELGQWSTCTWHTM